MTKKMYSAPELKVHGKVEQITLQSNAANADVPAGTANTAYPPLS